MRIDPNSSIARILGLRPKSSAPVSAATGAIRDSVELSARAEDLRVALDALKDTPPIREEYVARLRRQIEQGDFDVNAQAVARKLLGLGSEGAGDE
jgi:flagellar biosynthesis anti-sigma factor FlgM